MFIILQRVKIITNCFASAKQIIQRSSSSTAAAAGGAAGGAAAAGKIQVFDKILIANRGEIAIRVMRTAKKLGIKTVAVFSEADTKSLHVEMADEAFLIGGPQPAESYLKAQTIIDVAKRSGAQAIHPGYGFLSENAKFADEVAKSGLVFIGPPSSAIVAMGSKSESKKIMEEAGVACVPGYHGDNQDDLFLLDQARKINFPVMIKAVMGGGGKGMRIALKPEDFIESLHSARREAMNSFGDDRVLIEKYIVRPRHIEFQVFCDKHGNGVYLFERDCSLQRRHQKVIEEAPAPGMTPELRRSMGDSAVAAARAVGYVNAGTVEFIVDADTNEYYFMEMNTRLQVEHPVTEMITGEDLVDWQLQIAAGKKLPKSQDELKIHGHAFEARIYAENPHGGFLPTIGKLKYLKPPAEDAKRKQVRVETGVREGDSISIFYDPMIAKLVVHDVDRRSALRRLRNSLLDYHVTGLMTNINFLTQVCSHQAFQNGDVDTGFIPRYRDELLPVQKNLSRKGLLLAVMYDILNSGKFSNGNNNNNNNEFRHPDPTSPWDETRYWRPNYIGSRLLSYVYTFQPAQLPNQVASKSVSHPIRVNISYNNNNNNNYNNDHWKVSIADDNNNSNINNSNGNNLILQGERNSATGEIVVNVIGDKRIVGSVIEHDDEIQIFHDEGSEKITREIPAYKKLFQTAAVGSLLSPMPGKIVRVLASPGDNVKAGDTLLILSAMKMEHAVRSPTTGIVETIYYSEGDLVEEKKQLAIVKEATQQ